MSPKGGKREGAGKPALYNKPMKRVNVMLDPETIAFYKTQGKNLSEGIRNHWRGLTPLAADLGKAVGKDGPVYLEHVHGNSFRIVDPPSG